MFRYVGGKKLFFISSQSLMPENLHSCHQKSFPVFWCSWRDPSKVGLGKVILKGNEHYTCRFSPWIPIKKTCHYLPRPQVLCLLTWNSQPVSSLIYNIPSLIGAWPHPESWPRGFLTWGLAHSALVSVMKKIISEFGKAQKFYTASGGHPVQGIGMAHVPASSYRTCSSCHQDLRITEGSPVTAFHVCYL